MIESIYSCVQSSIIERFTNFIVFYKLIVCYKTPPHIANMDGDIITSKHFMANYSLNKTLCYSMITHAKESVEFVMMMSTLYV